MAREQAQNHCKPYCTTLTLTLSCSRISAGGHQDSCNCHHYLDYMLLNRVSIHSCLYPWCQKEKSPIISHHNRLVHDLVVSTSTFCLTQITYHTSNFTNTRPRAKPPKPTKPIKSALRYQNSCFYQQLPIRLRGRAQSWLQHVQGSF